MWAVSKLQSSPGSHELVMRQLARGLALPSAFLRSVFCLLPSFPLTFPLSHFPLFVILILSFYLTPFAFSPFFTLILSSPLSHFPLSSFLFLAFTFPLMYFHLSSFLFLVSLFRIFTSHHSYSQLSFSAFSRFLFLNFSFLLSQCELFLVFFSPFPLS